jgi:hypothetical protein
MCTYACGPQQDCPDPDFVVWNMNVCDRQNINPSSLMIKGVLKTVEKNFNKLYPGLDLRELIRENSVELNFQPIEDKGGWQLQNRMYVDGKSCFSTYFITGHELLHVIVEYHTDLDPQDDHDHMIRHVYWSYYGRTGSDRDELIIEQEIADFVMRFCEEQ